MLHPLVARHRLTVAESAQKFSAFSYCPPPTDKV